MTDITSLLKEIWSNCHQELSKDDYYIDNPCEANGLALHIKSSMITDSLDNCIKIIAKEKGLKYRRWTNLENSEEYFVIYSPNEHKNE